MPVPIPPKNKKEFSWGRFSKTLSFWILILLIPVVLIRLTGAKSEAAQTITYTQYRDALERDASRTAQIVAGKTVNGAVQEPARTSAERKSRTSRSAFPSRTPRSKSRS